MMTPAPVLHPSIRECWGSEGHQILNLLATTVPSQHVTTLQLELAYRWHLLGMLFAAVQAGDAAGDVAVAADVQAEDAAGDVAVAADVQQGQAMQVGGGSSPTSSGGPAALCRWSPLVCMMSRLLMSIVGLVGVGVGQ